MRRHSLNFRLLTGVACLFALLGLAACYSPPPPPGSPFSRQDLLRLSQSLSEEPGYFDSDNLITNESSYLHVLDRLEELNVQGGVYLGVGPEQNFTYMAATRPALAIILDIRRDNLLQQVWYKALFETSPSRSDFLSQMLGMPLPAEWAESAGTDIRELVQLFRGLEGSGDYQARLRSDLRAQIRSFGFELDRRDWEFIEKLQQAFFLEGLGLRFTSFRRQWQRRYPTLEQILLETDLRGRHRNFLNQDSDYQVLRRMQLENRVVPVTGDLAGTNAVKAIGEYCRRTGQVISIAYVSNVEFYLFRNNAWREFMENIKALPAGPDSVIIRSYFNYTYPHPEQVPGYYVNTTLQRLPDLTAAWEQGEIRNYWDLVTTRYLPLREESRRPAAPPP